MMIISLAKESDMVDLFELANDEVVRQNSFNSEKIELEHHKKWFLNKLKDQNCYFYIIREISDFIGFVRFDLEKNINEQKQFVIGIGITKEYRGQGLGFKIIEEAGLKLKQIHPGSKIIAHIKESNSSSLKVFLKAGYKIVGKGVKNNSSFHILEYQK